MYSNLCTNQIVKYFLIVLTFLNLSACTLSKTYYRSGNAVISTGETPSHKALSSATSSVVKLTIFDLHGDIVALYSDTDTSVRIYCSNETPEGLPSGIYFSRIAIGDLAFTTKKLRIR